MRYYAPLVYNDHNFEGGSHIISITAKLLTQRSTLLSKEETSKEKY